MTPSTYPRTNVGSQVAKALLCICGIILFIYLLAITGERMDEYNQCYETGRTPVQVAFETHCLSNTTEKTPA